MGIFAGNFANNFEIFYISSALEVGAGIKINLKPNTGTINCKPKTGTLTGEGITDKVIF